VIGHSVIGEITNSCQFLGQSELKTKLKSTLDFLASIFPLVMLVTCTCFLIRVLIGSFCVLFLLWLASVIALVLVLQQSIENCSIVSSFIFKPMVPTNWNILQTNYIICNPVHQMISHYKHNKQLKILSYSLGCVL